MIAHPPPERARATAHTSARQDFDALVIINVLIFRHSLEPPEEAERGWSKCGNIHLQIAGVASCECPKNRTLCPRPFHTHGHPALRARQSALRCVRPGADLRWEIPNCCREP